MTANFPSAVSFVETIAFDNDRWVESLPTGRHFYFIGDSVVSRATYSEYVTAARALLKMCPPECPDPRQESPAYDHDQSCARYRLLAWTIPASFKQPRLAYVLLDGVDVTDRLILANRAEQSVECYGLAADGNLEIDPVTYEFTRETLRGVVDIRVCGKPIADWLAERAW
jgi:hypothetical protein